MTILAVVEGLSWGSNAWNFLDIFCCLALNYLKNSNTVQDRCASRSKALYISPMGNFNAIAHRLGIRVFTILQYVNIHVKLDYQKNSCIFPVVVQHFLKMGIFYNHWYREGNLVGYVSFVAKMALESFRPFTFRTFRATLQP